jgi:hypothetical protein
MEARAGVIEVDSEDHPPGRQGLSVAAFVVASVGAVLFYALAYASRHLHMPAGDDALFYVVGLRSVAQLGLVDPQLAVRPAFPLVGSVLATVTGSDAWTMAVAAPIAFAAGTGLASAAIAARWRLRGPGLGAFAFLAATSVVVARLVAGKVENGMALWLMAAVLAVAVWGGPNVGVRRGVPVAALMCVATLVEWPLAVTFTAILAAAWVLSWLVGRRAGARGSGIEASETTLRLLILASLAGLAVGALVAFLWSGAGPGAGIQNLPPGYRYGARLRDELSLARPWLTAVLVAAGLWVAIGRERRPPALTVVLLLWLAATVAVLSAGWLGFPGPTYRVLLIALPIALAASAAPFLPLAGGGRGRETRIAVSRPIAWLLAGALAAAALVPGALFWWRATLGTPTSVEQLAEVTAAARYARSLPGDGPVVLVIGRTQLPFAESLLYSRMAQSVSPPNRSSRVLVFVGRAQDALAGRPSTGVGPGEDAVLRTLFQKVGPALAAGSPVLSGRALDPDGYASAVADGASTIDGESVAITRGTLPAASLGAAIRVEPVPEWPRLSAVSLLVLTLLTAIGLGWSRFSLPSSPPAISWLLAPAFGAGALTLIALVLVHAGVRPSGAGAWGELGLALAASGSAWWAARRRAAVPTPR